ncbi:MAG TPA: hypothetical protein VEV45_02945 [Streptosporangiaceae bacterium]|nr:hypothetical protein [Streptosporangiaceae bacterium]
MTAARNRWRAPAAALDRWRDIVRRWFLLALGVLCIGGGGVYFVADIAAATGNGTHGYFVAEHQTCLYNQGCHWDGNFLLADGKVVRHDVEWAGSFLSLDIGRKVPAIYERTSQYAYPPYSVHWAVDAVVVAFGFVLVGQWFLTRRGSRLMDRFRQMAGP